MRTMRLSSSDAAVEGSLGHSLRRDMVNRKALARANGASRRASGWAGENDARSWDHPSHPVKSDNSLGLCLEPGASQGKELSLIHISEPTRLLSISYAVFCLKKK